MVEQEPFKLLVVGSSPSTLTASWQSGNAVDCKSIMDRFDSYTRLKKKNLTLINKFCILRKMEKIMSNKEYQKSVWYKIERLFDRHNHLMEFIRTLFALITITLQLVILSRLV